MHRVMLIFSDCSNIELILSVNSDLATRLEKNLTESETGALVDTFTAFVSNHLPN